MAKHVEIEKRIEEAREFASSQYLEVEHSLDGEERISGDDRTFLLFERTYLQGLVDMAVYLRRGGSIADLAKTIAREKRQYRTGEIETGVLHVRSVGLEIDLNEVGNNKAV